MKVDVRLGSVMTKLRELQTAVEGVDAAVQAMKGELPSTSDNTAKPKLPSLEAVQSLFVDSEGDPSSEHDMHVIETVYNCIARQLSA